jgi:GNAT superfamily N-acetyltransferase
LIAALNNTQALFLTTEPAYRRKGLAQLLVAKLVQLSAQKGCQVGVPAGVYNNRHCCHDYCVDLCFQHLGCR